MLVRSLGWEDSPGGGKGNPLQYSCLENPMGRGAWQAKVNRVAKNQAHLKYLACTYLKSTTLPVGFSSYGDSLLFLQVLGCFKPKGKNLTFSVNSLYA